MSGSVSGGYCRGRSSAGLIAGLVIVLVVVGIVYWATRKPGEIGTIGILGAPPENAVPLLAEKELAIGENQMILRFSDGREVVAETGSVLDLHEYPEGRLGLARGGLFLSSGSSRRSLSVVCGRLDLEARHASLALSIGEATSILDVLAGEVALADGRRVSPGLSVFAGDDGLMPGLRSHEEKIGWVGRLLSDPERVRPPVEDTNLPGQLSGMVIMANSWLPVEGAAVRLVPEAGDVLPPDAAESDALGRFAHPRIPDGEYRFLARKDGLQTLDHAWDGTSGTVFQTYRPSHPLVLLHTVKPMRLVVRDDKGKPLPGVELTFQGDGTTPNEERTVEMGEKTELEFYAWPDWDVVVKGKKEGYHDGSAIHMHGAAADPDTPLELTLGAEPAPDPDGPPVRPPVIRIP